MFEIKLDVHEATEDVVETMTPSPRCTVCRETAEGFYYVTKFSVFGRKWISIRVRYYCREHRPKEP